MSILCVRGPRKSVKAHECLDFRESRYPEGTKSFCASDDRRPRGPDRGKKRGSEALNPLCANALYVFYFQFFTLNVDRRSLGAHAGSGDLGNLCQNFTTSWKMDPACVITPAPS